MPAPTEVSALGFLAKVSFDAATAMGDERTTSVDCESCGEEFYVDASMRIDVRPE